MNKLLIVGAGGLGRMVMESAQENFECYFVDDSYLKGTIICDTKVVGKICDIKELKSSYDYLIVAIGNNAFREELTNKAISYGYTIPNIFNHTAYISKYAKFGYGCIVLSNASIQNGASLGNGVVITANVEVHHDAEIFDFALVYSNSTIRTYAKICKRVKIGSNVTIKNNTAIEQDCIIDDGEVR